MTFICHEVKSLQTLQDINHFDLCAVYFSQLYNIMRSWKVLCDTRIRRSCDKCPQLLYVLAYDSGDYFVRVLLSKCAQYLRPETRAVLWTVNGRWEKRNFVLTVSGKPILVAYFWIAASKSETVLPQVLRTVTIKSFITFSVEINTTNLNGTKHSYR